MHSTLRQHLARLKQELSLGYGWVALLPSSKAGALMLLVTLLEPAVGLTGMFGAIIAWYAGQLAGASEQERPVCVFNGLLIGLYIAHTWVFSIEVVALTLMGGVFAGWLTVALGRLIWSQFQLPVLSLPFALLAMMMSAAAQSLSNLQLTHYLAYSDMLGNQLDRFLSAFGNLYFIPDPFVGLFVVLVILSFSRYYLFIASLGYLVAWGWLIMMGAAPEHLSTNAWDSNAILAALLVGALFSRPGWLTVGLALLAAVMACWMSLALGRILAHVQLVPFSTPFILASWLVLYAAIRNYRFTTQFNLLQPDFPERSFERAQVSRSRVGEPGSVPLALPFMGEWFVSQGMSGEHTHKGSWRYALDFIVMKQGRSFSGSGSQLSDFHCYNLPVLSPAYGQVSRVVNHVADNQLGTVNVQENWGNCVIIHLADGKCVVIAHLKPASVVTYPGAWVKPGDLLGYCGNSGRSPQPHIHMHVQTADDPACPTVPFHLCNVLAQADAQSRQYALAIVPQEETRLEPAAEGDARPFYLLAGRGLRYSVAHQEQVLCDWHIYCEVDDLGRLALVASSGARCLAETTGAVFACYERTGPADVYFDLWLLACGYTPASYQVTQWEERYTPARLLPKVSAKAIAYLCWPLASFARSQFERSWLADSQVWRQSATHRQNLTGITAQTQAYITPQLGCHFLTAEVDGKQYTLQACSSFQRADMGVPAWEVALQQPTRQ